MSLNIFYYVIRIVLLHRELKLKKFETRDCHTSYYVVHHISWTINYRWTTYSPVSVFEWPASWFLRKNFQSFQTEPLRLSRTYLLHPMKCLNRRQSMSCRDPYIQWKVLLVYYWEILRHHLAKVGTRAWQLKPGVCHVRWGHFSHWKMPGFAAPWNQTIKRTLSSSILQWKNICRMAWRAGGEVYQ